MVNDCQAQRKSLLSIAQDYENARKGPLGKDMLINDHVRVMCASFGLTELDATVRAKDMYQPIDAGIAMEGVKSNFGP